MTTAQDQQSRELLPCPFCGGNAAFDEHDDECYFRKYEAQRRAVDDADLTSAFEMLAAWNRRAPAEHAARALPASMKPVGYLIDWPDEPELGHYFAEEANDSARGQALHTAAQVLAMGRVPPGFVAVPMEPTAEMVDAAEEAYMPFGDMALAIQSAIAATRPPED